MDAQIRRLVLRRLLLGELPMADPVTMWAGPAAGDHACVVCEQPITRAFEYEMVFPGPPPLFMHFHCLTAWDDERRQVRRLTQRREA